MSDTIQENKFVELTYKVIDAKTGHVLSDVEFPLGYVHGVKSVLSSVVTNELEGKKAGDVIEAPIDCDQLYGPRDESLVFVADIENVPEGSRKVGAKVIMESEKGDTKTFYVTKNDGKRVTIDGNNPLCGRQAMFTLEIISVRDATDEEIEMGGAIIGTGIGGLDSIEITHTTIMEKGPQRVSPYFVPRMMANAIAGQLSIRFNLQGPSYITASACARKAAT